jgi:hypothetical protein
VLHFSYKYIVFAFKLSGLLMPSYSEYKGCFKGLKIGETNSNTWQSLLNGEAVQEA